MKIDGVWVLDSLALFGRDVDYAAAPPPMPARELAKGREPISWVGGWCYAIPATAREKKGAWELIRFLASQRSLEITLTAQEFTAASQGRPFLPGTQPRRAQNEWVYRRYIEGNPQLDRRLKAAMTVYNEMLETARYRPVTPVGQKLWNAHIWAMEDAIFHKKTPRQALDYYTAVVQRDLDDILHPPEGTRITNWRWFFWLYGVALVAVAVVVYRRDTRSARRKVRARRFSPFHIFARDDSPSPVGGQRGYFRAQWKHGVLCALPWLLGFVIFTGGPLLFSIVISFCRFDILNPADVVGLRNYAFMLKHDELFWKSLYNTAFMVIGVPLVMAAGLGIAVLLNLKVRGVAVWRTFF